MSNIKAKADNDSERCLLPLLVDQMEKNLVSLLVESMLVCSLNVKHPWLCAGCAAVDKKHVFVLSMDVGLYQSLKQSQEQGLNW